MLLFAELVKVSRKYPLPIISLLAGICTTPKVHSEAIVRIETFSLSAETLLVGEEEPVHSI
jgi:hypothetical protein